MKGPPWNWVPALGVKKLDDWDTGPKRRSLDDIFSLLDTINERVSQTDGHRPTTKTALTRSIAR